MAAFRKASENIELVTCFQEGIFKKVGEILIVKENRENVGGKILTLNNYY